MYAYLIPTYIISWNMHISFIVLWYQNYENFNNISRPLRTCRLYSGYGYNDTFQERFSIYSINTIKTIVTFSFITAILIFSTDYSNIEARVG